MLDFLLSDGRRVTLIRLQVCRQPVELNGRAETERFTRQAIRKIYPSELQRYLIRWPEGQILPSHRCIGEFESSAIDSDGYSGLVICWFVWHVDRHIREIVEPGIADLDWESQASDLAWPDWS